MEAATLNLQAVLQAGPDNLKAREKGNNQSECSRDLNPLSILLASGKARDSPDMGFKMQILLRQLQKLLPGEIFLRPVQW